MSKKNDVKLNNKKVSVSDEVDAIKFAKVLGIVVIFCAVVYGGTLILQKAGVFDAGYKKVETPKAVITYENILIGSVFNRTDGEYYVAFMDQDEADGQFLGNILINYAKEESKLPVYKVDMRLLSSQTYKEEEGNPGATDVSNLKIKGATLIKIVDGKISSYFEGTDLIYDELIKEKKA